MNGLSAFDLACMAAGFLLAAAHALVCCLSGKDRLL